MPRLANTDVLILDCQTTGANPERGSLLELGWTVTRASGALPESDEIHSRLITLPDGEEIPPRVSKITGITTDNLEDAVDPGDAWASLRETTQDLARKTRRKAARTVIHFARFEIPFLIDLQQSSDADEASPFDIVCTHEIARRLLPELPRRGLRALAGYFGLSVGELRRSAEHVAATAFVWKELVKRLDEDCDVGTFKQLSAWLDAPPPSSRGARVYPMAREKRLKLPNKPGVYRMLRSNGDLLYVGKATSLKQRVNSYFTKQRHVADRTLEMLTQAKDIKVTVTGSPLEAALLESDEIKRNAPPYNVALREGRVRICYTNPCFSSFSATPDQDHGLGPLPDRDTVGAFAALLAWLETGDAEALSEATVCEILAVAEEYAPDLECFADGMKLFTEARVASDTGNRLTLSRALLRQGGLLWKKRLEELALAKEEEPDEEQVEAEEETEAEEPTWDPEAVKHSLEGIVSRTAHLLRRARWMCRLSESTLVWSEPTRKKGPKQYLLLEKGQLAGNGDLGEQQDSPTPRGHESPMEERLTVFDLLTFDRLRILTTELRRLVQADTPLELRFGPRAAVGRETLARLLPWV